MELKQADSGEWTGTNPLALGPELNQHFEAFMIKWCRYSPNSFTAAGAYISKNTELAQGCHDGEKMFKIIWPTLNLSYGCTTIDSIHCQERYGPSIQQQWLELHDSRHDHQNAC
jgi:hypothetical protein